MDRRRTTALAAAPLVWLTLVAGPVAAAEDQPCLTALVLCAEEQPPAEAPAPPPTTTTTAPAPPPPPSEAEATEHLLRRMNEERTARGLPALQRRADVDGVAQAWSGRLAEERRLSHNDAYFTPESRARHGARALGENVAVNSSAEAAHVALMNSEDHRANILDARFTVVGLGAVLRDGSWWVTQDFVQPRAAAATPVRTAAAPTPPSAPPTGGAAPPPPTPTPTKASDGPPPEPVATVVEPALTETLRTESDEAPRTAPAPLATDVATPTPRAAMVAAVAASAGWVVLAAARRRIRRAAGVMPRSDHHPISTRFAP